MPRLLRDYLGLAAEVFGREVPRQAGPASGVATEARAA